MEQRHDTRYSYDSAGHQLSVIRAYGTPNASTTSYAYDADGHKMSETDPTGGPFKPWFWA